MLVTLIRKEILETVLDLRFVVASLLFMVLIPLSMYVSRVDYEQRLAGYQQESRVWRERHGTPEWGNKDVEGHGFRPPSVLSIFALGLDPYLPDRVVTNFSGVFQTMKEPNTDGTLGALLGQLDFHSCMTYVVSLMALIFTFNTVSGERERGTLRLLIAQAVPRGKLLLSKWLSKTIVLAVPYLCAVCLALLVLEASPQVTLGDSMVAASISMMLVISLLLIVCMTSLGVCLSTFARGSLQSITLLLSAWVILVLGIPRMTPMIAEIIVPSETRRVIGSRKTMLTEDLMTEFYNQRESLTDSLLSKEDSEDRAGIELLLRTGNTPGRYAPQVDALWREYRNRIPLELEKIEEQYRNQLQAKHTLAMILSRISPLCCYSYSMTSLAGTGVDEPENFMNNAKRYQHQISQLLYDNVIVRARGRYNWEKGFDAGQVRTLPDMAYARSNTQQLIATRVFDLLLLVVYTLLFYSMAFIRVVKYDVR